MKKMHQEELIIHNKVIEMEADPFEGYIINADPDKKEKYYIWQTAIGLPRIANLDTTNYLKQLAIRNIKGEISFEKSYALLKEYYLIHQGDDETYTKQADIIALRIASLLSEKAFTFSLIGYLSIHKKLFADICQNAGRIRNKNISTNEWVLRNQSVIYSSASELKETVEHLINEEKTFSFQKLSMDQIILHFATFISSLWQNHIFAEGTTIATAVFFIKYLEKQGFHLQNETFANNAVFFRNALIRANYCDLKNGIYETTIYLERFLKKLLINENHILNNQALIINPSPLKRDITKNKSILKNKTGDKIFYQKTAKHIREIKESFPEGAFFGRSELMKAIGLKPSRASELIKIMLNQGIIDTVSGYGKGKYTFKEDI